MLEVHCTKKLRTLLRLNIDHCSVRDRQAATLGTWYANIFNVEFDPYLYNKPAEPYLLMVNSDSLLSFYAQIPEELSLELFLAELPEYMKKCFVQNGFTQRQIEFLMPGFREVGLAKASDRRMLGYLRSIAFDYEDQIVRDTPYYLDDLEEMRLLRVKWKGPNDRKRPGLIKPTAKYSARYLASAALRRVT